MIIVKSAGHARSLLFGILVLLDALVFLKGFELQPLPEYKQLEEFRGEVVYFFEGMKSKEQQNDRFLVIRINNKQLNFYLGLSDYLDDDSGAYQQVKQAISVNDVISLKGYFMRGGLVTDGYYNIVEFEKNNIIYLNYQTMVSAVQAESDFNFKLFLFLNIVVIVLFVISLVKSRSGDDEESSDDSETKSKEYSSSLAYGETITTWAADIEGRQHTFRFEHQFWTGRKKYFINDKLVKHISGGLIESCRGSVTVSFCVDSHDIQFLFRASRESDFSYGGVGHNDESAIFDKDAGVTTSMELLIDGAKIKGSVESERRMSGWAAPVFIAIIVFILSVLF